MSDIFSKLNDRTFYSHSDKHDKLVTVIRKTTGLTLLQRLKIQNLTIKDFYDGRNNEMFSQLCPLLVWYRDSDFIGLWMNICMDGMNGGSDFLIVRMTLGEILLTIAEIMTGDPIEDRGSILYNFGKPIEIEELLERYKTLANQKENVEIIRRIVLKAGELRKCCKYKTRGAGSITRAIEKIC